MHLILRPPADVLLIHIISEHYPDYAEQDGFQINNYSQAANEPYQP